MVNEIIVQRKDNRYSHFFFNLVQFEKQMRGVFSHNMEIEENINDLNERLFKCQEKLRVLDNMIELASQSLRTYFDNVRMINEYQRI